MIQINKPTTCFVIWSAVTVLGAWAFPALYLYFEMLGNIFAIISIKKHKTVPLESEYTSHTNHEEMCAVLNLHRLKQHFICYKYLVFCNIWQSLFYFIYFFYLKENILKLFLICSYRARFLFVSIIQMVASRTQKQAERCFVNCVISLTFWKSSCAILYCSWVMPK